MQDKSINGALLALRKNIIRGNLDGLAHVEALLTLRGVHMPAVLPAKKPDVAKCGHMSRWVLDYLKDGPKGRREIAEHIAGKRPNVAPDMVYRRTGQALDRLKHKGRIVRCDGGWRLA